MKRVFSSVAFILESDIPKSLEKEKSDFQKLCVQQGISLANEIDDDTLVITCNHTWNVNGLAIKHLTELFDLGILVPHLCVKNINRDEYGTAIAMWQEKVRVEFKKKKSDLDALAQEKLSLLNGLEDTYEWLTGGVFFYDYEWFRIQDDPIKKVLEDTDSEGSSRYLLELDDKVLLRGPDIYYYYSCYISRYKKPTFSQIEIWFDNCDIFLQKLIPALKIYSKIDNYARRMLLAVLDNIRNIILLMANSEIFLKTGGKSCCSIIDSSMIWCWKIDCYQNLIWKVLSGEQFDSCIEGIIALAEWTCMHMLDIRSRLREIEDDFILAKCFNPLREVDNYFENYIILQNIAEHLDKKPLNLIGVIYGGLELPFILKRIRNNPIEDSIAMVFQNNGMYLDKQKKNPQYSYSNLHIYDSLNAFSSKENILIDENIMSGLTMQLIINDLAEAGIRIAKCAVIRHPCINRLEQILHYDVAVNIKLLGQFIIGALAATPYSKIRKGTNHADMFTDELYIFSVMTEVFLKGLYKNNSFIPDSEVDIFRGFSPGHSIPTKQ